MHKIERPLLNTDLLRTFVVIADHENLTSAAEALSRTQSAISVQLRKLETDLQTTLFVRNSRGMVLTDAGRLLLPKARTLLLDLQQTSALFQSPLTGSLRVGIPDDFDATILERILALFVHSHPEVDVIATSGCTSGYPAAIEREDLDIAVCSSPDNQLGELLETEETVWVKKDSLVLQSDKPVPLALLDRSCWWHGLPTKALDAQGRDYVVTFTSGSFASLQAAIRAGFAVGVLPKWCVEVGMSVLTKSEGFPKLPSARRSIVVANKAPKKLTAAMASAIKQARFETPT